VIKRVTQVTEDKVWLEGDNKEDSYDSRYVGWIDKANIFGKILFI
jgi:type IV secretory pathway protease TraF